jgi:2,3-bisphosphoglycerate-dependent phosphoglycerate mutase
MTNFELILLRHGESEWNAKNLFTGWVDVRLSEKGEAEAARGGSMLAERGLLPDVVSHLVATSSNSHIAVSTRCL